MVSASDKPTPEVNSQRIDSVVGAIHELQQSGERAKKQNWIFLITVLGVITTAAGFWGNEMLVRLRSVESAQSDQAKSLGIVATRLDYQEKFEGKLDEIEQRLRVVERDSK